MRLSGLGEFGLIERIMKKTKRDRSVLVGIGDDCAVIKNGRSHILLTTDMLIEDVHFKLRSARPRQIGQKALAVNISDIAAMGGLPRYALVGLSVPQKVSVKFIDALYAGMSDIAARFKLNIVGGDINSSDKLTVSVSLAGEVEKSRLVLRRGAKRGDKIFVTGSLGGSIHGRHLNFMPRLKEARALVSNFRINSMIDLSDGMACDLRRVCEQSRVGARISEAAIPLSKYADSVKGALCDGEDFELLFSASPEEARRIEIRWPRLSATRLSLIGEIVPKRFGIGLVDREGGLRKFPYAGYAHF